MPSKRTLIATSIATLLHSASAVSCADVAGFVVTKSNNCQDAVCTGDSCGGISCESVIVTYSDGSNEPSRSWYYDNWENNDVTQELLLNGIEDGQSFPPLGLDFRSEVNDNGDRVAAVYGNGQACGKTLGGKGCTLSALQYEGSPSTGERWSCDA